MKKLILTSPQFEGEVELLYGTDMILAVIDLQNAKLTEKQIKFMKSLAPIQFTDITEVKAAFQTDTLHIAEADYKVTFDMFWDKYGIKRNRDRSEKLWNKMSEANKVKAYSGLNAYLRFLALNSWRNKAQPDTYLKDQYWLNEWK
jgi:hypothetical protein